MLFRALFLDRDGVINETHVKDGKPYPPSTLKEMVFVEGVHEALQMSKSMGFLNIIVTNQPDISTGRQCVHILDQIHQYIQKELLIDDIFVCPHTDEDNCFCRKPLPGMLLEAQKKWKIDFNKSFLVGDRWRDIEAAQAIGCESFFIDYGYHEKQPPSPYHRVASLKKAVYKIKSLTR